MRLPLSITLCLGLLAAPAAARPKAKDLVSRLGIVQGEERLRVIAALGRARPGQAVDPLLDIFEVRSAGPGESAAVVRALGRLGDKRALAPLMQAWDYLSSLRLGGELAPRLQILRAEIVEALGEIRDPRAAPLLKQALQDEDARVAARACAALGRIGDKKSVPMLLELLKKGGGVRQSAFEALGEIGSKQGKGTLERARDDSDPFIRAQASYALARMDDKSGVRTLRALLDEEKRFHKYGILAAYYLARLGEPAGLEYLAAVMGDAKSSLKLDAVGALGKSRNRKAVEPLAGHLEDKDPLIRLAVVQALGRLGGKRAAHQLQRAKEDADRTVASAARLALAELGEDED